MKTSLIEAVGCRDAGLYSRDAVGGGSGATTFSLPVGYVSTKTAEKVEVPKFAFLIHPLTADDLGRRGAGMIRNLIKIFLGKRFGGWIAKKLSIDEDWGRKNLPNNLIEKILPYLPGRLGHTVCSRFDVLEKANGFIVATLLTGTQFKKLPRTRVQKRILKNILFCQNKLGASTVGLGALNAPLLLLKSGKSIFFASNQELEAELDPKVIKLVKKITCRITDGDALSAFSAIPGIIQGLKIRNARARKAGLPELLLRDSICTVIGATGVVGGGFSRLLAVLKQAPKELRLIAGTRKDALIELRKEILASGYKGEVKVALKRGKKELVQGSDIVVTCTTGIGDIVTPDMIDPQQLVVGVDMARPINMSPKLLEKRPNIIHIDGGIIDTLTVDTRFDMGAGGTRQQIFACLAQTMLETATGLGKGRHTIGKVDLLYAIRLWREAEALGFQVASPKSFKKEHIPS